MFVLMFMCFRLYKALLYGFSCLSLFGCCVIAYWCVGSLFLLVLVV